MLVTLSFLITVDADVLTRRSLLDRAPIPGKGRISRLQTSAKIASKRARSLRVGARKDIRAFVASNEWDRCMFNGVEAWALICRTPLVFFRIT